MDLLIVRHGESEAAIEIREGEFDYDLTEKGHKEAELLATYLKENFKITKIYSSTLKRARQTIKHVSDKLNLEVIFDEELVEFKEGLLAGVSKEKALKEFPLIKDLKDDEFVYGMESRLSFRTRASNMLNKIKKECSNDDVVLVLCHGGMINELYATITNLPLSNNKTLFYTDDTGIHLWKLINDRIYIIKSNMSYHLKGLN